MVTTEDKQGFLLSIYTTASNASVSLQSLLLAAVLANYCVQGAGKTIIATSGNGRSTSVLMPDYMKTLTQDESRRLWVQLYNCYNDTCQNVLNITIPAITDYTKDVTIFNAMWASDFLTKCTSMQDDFTAMRYPSYGPTTS